MPRMRRSIGQSGIYHVWFRGVNKCRLFESTGDYILFLRTLSLCAHKEPVKIFAYCLMNNHVHLLIQEDVERRNLSQYIKRVLSRYAGIFNKRHGRTGTLFQGRFGSKPIENAQHFMDTMVYIHKNPVKAQLVDDLKTYLWSSYVEHFYHNTQLALPKTADNGTMLKLELKSIPQLFDPPVQNYADVFMWRHLATELESELVQKVEHVVALTDDEAFSKILKVASVTRPEHINTFENDARDAYICDFYLEGLSCKQISRLVGVGVKQVYKVVKRGAVPARQSSGSSDLM